MSGLFFVTLLPGRAALIMFPQPGELGVDAEDLVAAGRAGLEWLAERSLHYAQVLVEPSSVSKRSAANALGFELLTRLIYLERSTAGPRRRTINAPQIAWLPFFPNTNRQFVQCILDTYEASLDCPELTGLRPIEDVIASHRAAGKHDPTLWELALIDGIPAGALLLAGLPTMHALEVVYMGVSAAYRGRGVGAALLERALVQARSRGAQRLTLVVDERNAPARKLYQRFAFEAFAERDALLHTLGRGELRSTRSRER